MTRIMRGDLRNILSACVWYRQTKIPFPDPGTADATVYLSAAAGVDAP
jgi:hypothetical protein